MKGRRDGRGAAACDAMVGEVGVLEGEEKDEKRRRRRRERGDMDVVLPTAAAVAMATGSIKQTGST